MRRKKLRRLAKKWQPYDFGWNLRMEIEMFRQQAEYFEHSDIAFENPRRARIARLLVRLLEIFMSNENLELIDPMEFEPAGNEMFQLSKLPTWEYHGYVNTRNAHRFTKNHISDNAIFLASLREVKAWYLYNKMRYYYMQDLWD